MSKPFWFHVTKYICEVFSSPSHFHTPVLEPSIPCFSACLQSLWILCFLIPILCLMVDTAFTALALIQEAGVEKIQEWRISTVRKHMVQMLKLNELFFWLWNLEQEVRWRCPHPVVCLFLWMRMFLPPLWQESHRTTSQSTENLPVGFYVESHSLVYSFVHSFLHANPYDSIRCCAKRWGCRMHRWVPVVWRLIVKSRII